MILGDFGSFVGGCRWVWVVLGRFGWFWVILPGSVLNYVSSRTKGLLGSSSYEPGNRAGSVTGSNFVVCSYGTFQPSRPG